MPTVGPAQGAQALGRERREVFALEQDASAGLAQAGRQQAEHGARRHRLAAAGFADHGQEFAALDMEGDVVDHGDAGARGLDAQVVDREQRCGHPCAILRIEAVAQRVAEQVDAEQRQRDAQARARC